MSGKTIDEKVVEMRFDNNNFERNVSTTMSTLDKLKEKLNLTGASKGLENISSAANNVKFDGISNGLDSVQAHFSNMQVVAMTAISRITNAVIDLGKRIVDTFAIQPVTTGFNEYEQKMGAIQTIMAGTGEKLPTVKKYLEELNKYADDTIYSFSDMTTNIGKFTNAGISLKDSVAAIKGVANVAAVSGATAAQASHAMYNFAQALSMGYVQLIDWKSIENANMATDEFKRHLLDTAVALGTVKKEGKDTYKVISKNTKGKTMDGLITTTKHFRDSLSYQWMTTDVLVKTLNDYSDATTKIGKKATKAATEVKTFTMMMNTLKEAAQSGWGYTWEYIFGDFNEAKKMWTEASNYFSGILDASAKARNDMLKQWHDLGGRNDLIQVFRNLAGAIESLIKPIKEAFREIFPRKTGKDLFEITKRLKDFTARLKIGEETASKIKATFKGFFSILSTGLNIFKTLANAAWEIVKSLFGFSGNILDATAKIGTFFTKISEGLKQTNFFNNAVSGMTKMIKSFIESLKGFSIGFLGKFGEVIKTIATAIGGAVSRIFKTVGEAINNGDAAKFMDLLNKGLFSMVLLKLKKFINYMAKGGTFFDTLKSFVNSVKGIADSIAGILNTVKDSLVVWQQTLKVKVLMKIATAIGILALALVVLSDIPKDKLEAGLSAITTLFIDLVAALRILMAGKLDGGKRAMNLAIGLAISVNILASALNKVAKLDAGELTKGVIAIFALVKIMTTAINKIATNTGKAVKGALGIIAMGVAIKILASAVEQLGMLDLPDLAKGVIAVGALIGALGLFIRFSKTQNAKMVKTGLGIILLAAGLKILASVCKDLAELSWEGIGKALAGIGGLLAEIAGFSALTKFFKKTITAGIAMNIFALAMKNMVKPIKELGEMDWDGIKRSLTAIGGVFAIFTATMLGLTLAARLNKGDPFGLNLMFAAMSIQTLTNMLSKICEAFVEFSKLSWEDIGKSLVSIGVSMGILVGATKLMKTQEAVRIIICAEALNILAKSIAILGSLGLQGVAIGLLGFAGIFTILAVAGKVLKPLLPTFFKLAGAIATLSGSFILLSISMAAMGAGLAVFVTSLVGAFVGFKMLGLDTIAKGLIALAGAFIIIGVAAKVLRPLTTSILALAGTMIIFGLSVAAIGVGVSLIASALATMAAVGKEGAETAGLALKALVQHILELIPIAVKQIGLGLIELLKIIRDTMPLIGEVVKETVLMLVDVLVTCAPAIARGFFETIVETLKMLVQYVPQIVDLLFEFAIQVLNKLATKIPDFIVALFNFLSTLFDACIAAFNKLDPNTFLKGVTALGILLIAMHLMASIVTIAPKAMLGVLAFGVLLAELAAVLWAVGQLNQIPGFQALVESGGNLLQAVGTAIGQFIGGIIGGLAKGMTSVLPDVATNLSQFMTNLQPFLEGINNMGLDVAAKTALLGAAILVLSTAGFIAGIQQIIPFVPDLASLGTQLSNFMTNASGFLEGANSLDANVVNSVKTLAEAILILTGANLLNNLSSFMSFFTGGNSLEGFGKQIESLGSSIKGFMDSIGTFGDEQIASIQCACEALKIIAGVGDAIPNSGGLNALFNGDNDLGAFGAKLPLIGMGLSLFLQSLGTFNEDQIKTVDCAARCIKLLAEAGNEIPNSGGLNALVNGDNDLGWFSAKLPIVGWGLSKFIGNLGTFSDEQVKTIDAAGRAIKALAEAANGIPNSGGLNALFNGDNDISKFSGKLPNLGTHLANFVTNIGTFGDDQIKTVDCAGNAIKALAEAANGIPNSGGLKTLFEGDNDIAVFGLKLPIVGKCLRGFVDSLGTFNNDQISTAECAAKCIATMATVASQVPNSGGLAKIFTGSNDISAFANKLPSVGYYLASFIEEIGEFTTSQVEIAKYASEALAIMASVNVPATGGLSTLFTGNNDISTYVSKLPSVGYYLSEFINQLNGFSEAQVLVTRFAAQALAEMASVNIPTSSSGLRAIFTGNNDISTFASKLPGTAVYLGMFVEKLEGFTTDDVSVAKLAAEALAGMASVNVPTTNGGFKALFEGDNDISTFAGKLPQVGACLKSFIESVGTFGTQSLDTVRVAVEAMKVFTGLGQIDIQNTGEGLLYFGNNIILFADELKEYLNRMSGVDSKTLDSTIEEVNKIINMAKSLSTDNIDGLKNFGESLTKFGKEGANGFVNAYKDSQLKTDLSNAVAELIKLIKEGISKKKEDIAKAAKELAKKAKEPFNDSQYKIDVKNLGRAFAQGFANGIRENKHLAAAEGTALGNAAYNAAKTAIDSHSPSKKARKLGNFFGVGFVNGIRENIMNAYSESKDMAEHAVQGLSNAISNVTDMINNDMDSQPTIRPILDLSDVENGVGTLNSMFMNPTIGAASNLNAISVGMRSYRQNGGEDVVSAINKLGKNLSNMGGDTYHIDGITYDDGSNVSEAVRTLVHAAKIERRT